MKPQITLLEKESNALDVLVFLTPIFLVFMLAVTGINPFKMYAPLYQLAKSNEILVTFLSITLITGLTLGFMTSFSFKRIQYEKLLKTLSQEDTLNLRLKIDAYLISIGYTPSTTYSSAPCLMLGAKGANAICEENPLTDEQTLHLQTFFKEELVSKFSERKIKELLKLNVLIPLHTTQPSAHQFLKMEKSKAQSTSHKFLTFGLSPTTIDI
jgi:hypothetical protein